MKTCGLHKDQTEYIVEMKCLDQRTHYKFSDYAANTNKHLMYHFTTTHITVVTWVSCAKMAKPINMPFLYVISETFFPANLLAS